MTFEFVAGEKFLYSGIREDDLVSAELLSQGKAQVELREFNRGTYERGTYEFQASGTLHEGRLTGFFIAPHEGSVLPLVFAEKQEDRTILESKEALDPGTWTLRVRRDFEGNVKLAFTGQPSIVLALTEGSAARLDTRIQTAMLEAIDATAIRESLGLQSPVVLDEASFGPRTLVSEPGAEDAATTSQLLDEAGVADGLAVQIQVEEKDEEEPTTLLAVAGLLEKQLLAIGLDVTIAPCTDICMRVFFATEGNASEGL